MPPRPEGPSGPPVDDDGTGTPDEGVGPPDEGDQPDDGGAGAPPDEGDQPEDGVRPPDDGPGAGDDERWAQIVDQLRDVDGAADGWTVGPDGPPARRRQPGRVVRAAQPPSDPPLGGPPVSGGRDWDGTAQYDEAEDAVDAQEHFVPPDPAPVLGGNPLLTLAWTLVVGVPVLYVVMLIAWRHPPGWLAPVAGVGFLAGLAVLLWHMPHRRDDADDDSGAVV
jgi:hypothetical protein